MGGVLPLILAFLGGVLISFINYLLTRALLNKGTGWAFAMPLRVLVTAAFIAGLYFIARALSIKLFPFLLAGALGATAGLAVFTFGLIKNGKGGGKND